MRASLLSRLTKGTLWNGLALALNQGGTLLGSIIIARVLGQAAFGQYAIVLAALMSVAVLAQTGLAYAATKYIAEFRTADLTRTGRIVSLCSILGPALAAVGALGVVVAAPFVAEPLLGSAKLALPFALGGIFIFFYASNSYQVGALSGLERYRALVIPAAICALLTVVCITAGAKLAGINGAIAGLSAASAVRWFLHQRTLKTECLEAGIAVSTAGIWRELPLLYTFAIPAALSAYLMVPGLWITNAWLVRQPGGFAQMGHYTAAQTLRLVVMFAPVVLNSVGLAILNNTRRGDAGSYGSVHRMNRIAVTSSTALAAVSMALCARPLLQLFGNDFSSGGNSILWLLLASAVVESLLMGYFQIVQSAGRMWLGLAAVALPWQAAFVTSAYFFIPRYGASGLAAANLAGLCTALVATLLAVAAIGTAWAAGNNDRSVEEKAVSWLGKFAEVLRLARWVRTQYYVRKDPVAYARSLGVTIGEGSHLYGGDIGTFGSEPYLVTIGKNCHIGHEVRFITHDGMAIVLRAHHPDIDLVARIEVGDNVAIGMRSIILPDVRIGSNCIIGCASVVNRDVPDNSIVAGVPARVIGSLEDYERKVVGRSIHTGTLQGREKEQRIRELFAVGQPGGR